MFTVEKFMCDIFKLNINNVEIPYCRCLKTAAVQLHACAKFLIIDAKFGPLDAKQENMDFSCFGTNFSIFTFYMVFLRISLL